MRYLLPILVLAMACDTPHDHDHEHDDTTVDEIDVMALACDAVSEMSMPVVATSSKDDANIPEITIGLMPQLVTLPDSGTGWVKIPNDTHRDVTWFFDRQDIALGITSDMQTLSFDALMPVDTCEEIATHQLLHMHNVDAYLELDGKGGDLWILATDAAGGGDHNDMDMGDGADHDDGDHEHEDHDDGEHDDGMGG